jgi:exodeoxyribonuclease V alpha subunit
LGRYVDLIAIDIHFGGLISRLSAGSSGNVVLAAALASMATRAGHACLELSAWTAKEVGTADGSSCRCPELPLWLAELTASSAVGDGRDATPLVLEKDRLYLHRYWQYETEVAEFVIGRGKLPDVEVSPDGLGEVVARLFPEPVNGCDRQRLAAMAAVLRPFVVINGGPGTGKTTTVARIIALLVEQWGENENIRIALAAPTGKAAVRLQKVMGGIRKNLACSASVREQIPTKVVTLHRLLGFQKDTPFFRHSEKNKLPYDLVVVDEASMIDLPLMAKLVRALRSDTKLVLLGDRNQLASVEPGAILGDICLPEAVVKFPRKFLDKACRVPDMDGLLSEGEVAKGSLVELQVSHRFGADSGIGLVGQAITRGDPDAALEVFRAADYPDVVWRDIDGGEQLRLELSNMYENCPPGWFGVEEAELALHGLGSFQVLCAVRHGAFGVVMVNRYIEEALAGKWDVVPGGVSYPGRPVMVVANNYELQLYNGDTGIIKGVSGKDGELQVVFPAGEKGLHKLPLAMLPDHETAYAMTVHKSQGGEFDKVVLILPDRPSAVLSRELLYTALTRARQSVEVWGSPEIFKGAVATAIRRHSGLGDKIRSS